MTSPSLCTLTHQFTLMFLLALLSRLCYHIHYYSHFSLFYIRIQATPMVQQELGKPNL